MKQLCDILVTFACHNHHCILINNTLLASPLYRGEIIIAMNASINVPLMKRGLKGRNTHSDEFFHKRPPYERGIEGL